MPKRPGYLPWAKGACLVGLVLIAYLPVWRAGFIWDDDVMLTTNRLVHATDGLDRFWFTSEGQDYWPVTYSTLWLEWRLWGSRALGYHLTNLALHGGEVLLLWSVLRRLRLPGAWLAALVFAVHPLNVESVAWIAQRKNLLAMLFYLLSIDCFLRTSWSGRSPVSSPDSAGGAPPARAAKWYAVSLLAFLLGMLSKGSVAMLPFVLLGVIWWRRRPTYADFLRLAPFGAVAAGLTAVNIWFQRHGMPETIRHAGALERLLGAGTVIWFYLGKALWPARLIFIYPQWQIQAAHLRWWLPTLAALGLTVLLWRLRDRGGRPWLFAWGYFCVSLVPVMGLTDVYFMKYSLVADHYAHLALIGVAAAIGWAGHRLYRRAAKTARLGLAVLAAGAVGALAGRTWCRNLLYRDDVVLYRATLAENPACWLAANNLGVALAAAGQLPAAEAAYRRALAIRSDYAQASNNLGSALNAEGRTHEAIVQYLAALRLKPDYAEAHYNLANAWKTLPGGLPRAIAEYEVALRLKPDYARAHNNLGTVLAAMGRTREALAEYEVALRLRPDYAKVHYNLGYLLEKTPGRRSEAIAQYEAAQRLDPSDADAHYHLGNALIAAGRTQEAVVQYEAVLRLRPNDAEAHYNLGLALRRTPGRRSEAIAEYEAALRLRPAYADAHNNLGNALIAAGRTQEAINQYEMALRLQPNDAAAHFNLGITLLGLPGREAEAKAELEAARRLGPKNPAGWPIPDAVREALR